ncbi:hypothetical protein CVT26_000549 [Gymnopilus dilepis]|uniref:Cytochrome P450 n=1 Tax=Gymnopilus dilepis TaxID=231916 RepID=A0A409VH90_9AGAR|nr:hypothetical protein CVT26_000549 [Gymnopilus dilepis]
MQSAQLFFVPSPSFVVMYSSFVLSVDISHVAVLLLLSIFLWSFCAKPRSLPPGPRGLPLVGNILDMPSEKEWLTFARWGETWGDICSVTVLGQPLIILNSARMACAMLDKKSSIYSDRPVLQMGGELVGWKNTMVLLPYGDRFRRYRRMCHSLIGSAQTIQRFYPSEELEARRFLRRVLNKPADLSAHVRKTAGAVILRITHGYEVKETNDPFVELADKATEQFSLATAPGGFLVDLLPALRYVPLWFPGANFKRKALEWSKTLHDMVDGPYAFVKQQMASGSALVSYTSTLLQEKQLTTEEELDLKWSAASLYSEEGLTIFSILGAADTTVSALNSFFLALALHPKAMEKAQAEIDSVIGNDRLPTFDDRQNLPYTNALVSEVFRWHTVVPTAVPHRVTEDDIHEGYFIPKGALSVTVTQTKDRKFAHDPEVYANPFEFNPERFLQSEGRNPEPDPRDICFGFGRRLVMRPAHLIHLGMHLADASIWISCAMSLAVFDVRKCIEDGQVIEPVHENTTGTISHPEPFKCTVKPRTERAISLILAEH